MSNFIQLLLLEIYHNSRTNTNQRFLFTFGLYNHTTNHPQEDLARFGTYRTWEVQN
jgi:hypothetical protein